jgi:PPOX class probable F420-dependent enzyme
METIPDSHRDLLEGQFATLATVGPNGRPQQSLVWFLAEGDTVRMSLSAARQKTTNLQGHSACSLVIVDPGNSFRYLELRGNIELEPDPGYEFAGKVGAKYNADLRQYDAPGETRFVATLVTNRARAVSM